VLPEVKARQDAEAAAKQAERLKLAEALKAGKAFKLPSVRVWDLGGWVAGGNY
jgi:hypothetical protein